ncbi:MAG: DUF1800 family protein [Candidatus Binatia bacterium]|nr:DUF1800 family protein [Candidatus Binatia bacterium]
MGDENTALSAGDVRHLLRRTGFGAKPKEVEKMSAKYPTRGAAADKLLKFKPANFRPGGKDIRARQVSWFKYMLKGKRALQEKMVLFLHDHFATNNDTLGDDLQMANQNRLLRQGCIGDFKQLVKDINLDPAMMDFLDTVRNRKEQPNENYPRELLELFTVGVTDFQGNNNYEQEDIVQIARAFSGWRLNEKDDPFLQESRHDFMEDFPKRGPKVIFQTTGSFGPGGRSFTTLGEGATEIEEVIDILFEHTDSDGENTVARRIARRLLEYFAHGAYATSDPPTAAAADAVIAESGFDSNWDLGALIRAILVSDAFYETAGSGPATPRSVKWPIDYAVTSMRLLGMKLKGKDARLDGGARRRIVDHLSDMGQELFDPPSVFGWDWENSWITSRTVLSRAIFARDLTVARGNSATGFRPHKLMDTELTDPPAIVDAVTDVLGVSDRISPTERAILIDYLTDEGVQSSIDLENEDVVERKLAGLFAVVMQSPAYQLH